MAELLSAVSGRIRADPEAILNFLFDLRRRKKGFPWREAAKPRDIETSILPVLEGENQKAFAEDGEATSIARLLKLLTLWQGKLTEADKQTMIDNKAVDGTLANVKLD